MNLNFLWTTRAVLMLLSGCLFSENFSQHLCGITESHCVELMHSTYNYYSFFGIPWDNIPPQGPQGLSKATKGCTPSMELERRADFLAHFNLYNQTDRLNCLQSDQNIMFLIMIDIAFICFSFNLMT